MNDMLRTRIAYLAATLAVTAAAALAACRGGAGGVEGPWNDASVIAAEAEIDADRN